MPTTPELDDADKAALIEALGDAISDTRWRCFSLLARMK
jgi:hypothetical protein